MKKRMIMAAAVVLTCAAVAAAIVGGFRFRGLLHGYNEVPAVSTVATGDFTARISKDESQIDYELTYSDLEGSVTQAHIHFGQPGVNGGISVWLCGNPGPGVTPPAGTQACPPSPATITGTLTAANVVGPAAQGIAAGEFEELVNAIRAGKTYANVHSTKFPGGEVRDQLAPGEARGAQLHGKH